MAGLPAGSNIPPAAFRRPLAVLQACHGLIRNHCDSLERLPDYLIRHGPDERTSTAAQRALRYFRNAAPLHFADEEIDLFPRLLTVLDSREEKLADTILELVAQHGQELHDWAVLEPFLETVAAGERPSLPDLRGYAAGLRQHIGIEEMVIYPLASRLDPDSLTHIGVAMAARRHAG
ncbi:hemerythrin domain-containing protein [Acidithiobacillus sulfuriphilus]|uniref:Hemerythrin domain-containing protein n=2 Tax=Acidithiobacillus sulfuriphilus TaxID=1867749 RepID=A0A3M8QXT0_9PROT|nr:hemerythrin domain-containing protein [Acidithiobacillus sulfuriphilus]RNF59300.1 hemerythrin domain-containing protein [Acidithiobacillus sulfuriphilus]